MKLAAAEKRHRWREIRCSEGTQFVASDQTNDVSHTWKTSFAPLIGENVFPYENLHSFSVRISVSL